MTRNAERTIPRPYGWFRFPRRSCACACVCARAGVVPTKGLNIIYPSRARPLVAARGKREKRVVLCTNTKGPRGGARATQHFLDERERIHRVRVTRILH